MNKTVERGHLGNKTVESPVLLLSFSTQVGEDYVAKRTSVESAEAWPRRVLALDRSRSSPIALSGQSATGLSAPRLGHHGRRSCTAAEEEDPGVVL